VIIFPLFVFGVTHVSVNRGERRLKFRMKKGKGSVSGYTDERGVTHRPGDVVDLPVSMKGEKWLEPVEPEKPVKAPAAKVEKVMPEDADSAPKKSSSKKSVKAPES
jgi:hypothetical protein